MTSIFVSKKLDSRKDERLKQLISEFNKQLKIGEVEGSLVQDLLKIDPNYKLPENLTVKGSLNLFNTLITELPENLTVNGYLDLSDTQITKLPDNLTIKGNLYLSDTKIIKLPNNLTIKGNLYLTYTHITQLPNNLIVNGSLYLNNTPISKNKELINMYKQKYKIIC